MNIEEIAYMYEGKKCSARIRLLSPLSWIFLVTSDQFDSFHLEFDEFTSEWTPIEEDLSIPCSLWSGIAAGLSRRYGKQLQRNDSSGSSASRDFFIADNDNEPIICMWDSYLRIRVLALNDRDYEEDAGELMYYADDCGHTVAFRTIDYQGEDPQVILDAIAWYAECQNRPEMIILNENPLSI